MPKVTFIPTKETLKFVEELRKLQHNWGKTPKPGIGKPYTINDKHLDYFKSKFYWRSNQIKEIPINIEVFIEYVYSPLFVEIDHPIEIKAKAGLRAFEYDGLKTKINLIRMFPWHKSIERISFWEKALKGDYSDFYEKYPKDTKQEIILIGKYGVIKTTERPKLEPKVKVYNIHGLTTNKIHSLISEISKVTPTFDKSTINDFKKNKRLIFNNGVYSFGADSLEVTNNIKELLSFDVWNEKVQHSVQMTMRDSDGITWIDEFGDITKEWLDRYNNGKTTSSKDTPILTTKPNHYQDGIDTFARMEANCTKDEILGFIKGNIDKYNWREKGQNLEDFDKIIAYANWGKKILNK